MTPITFVNILFRFSVFALGSSAYPKFCQFGKYLDSTFDGLGADRMMDLGSGDELNRQEQSFQVRETRKKGIF